MTIQTKPLNGNIGLEILGLDLSLPLSEADAQDIYQAWLDAGILLFRDTKASPEQQIELS